MRLLRLYRASYRFTYVSSLIWGLNCSLKNNDYIHDQTTYFIAKPGCYSYKEILQTSLCCNNTMQW